MRTTSAFTVAAAVGLILAGCGKVGEDKPASPKPAASPAPPTASADPYMNVFGATPGDEKFDLKAHPDAQVLHALDPATLTETQRKFGIAPRRDKSVDYQPDIILMEQGDKAIRSIAPDGLIWTFDANAPLVSDFQEGKIVFATSRAVGRVLMLKRQGDTVQVILGPIQLTDVILNGSFAMNESLNFDTMLKYEAPDWPQPPPDQGVPPGAAPAGFNAGQADSAGRFIKTQAMMPGVPGVNIPQVPKPIPPLAPPGKSIDIDQGSVRMESIGSNSGVGIQFYYNKDGVGGYAGSSIDLSGSQLGFFLDIKGGRIRSCGIQILAASGIKVSMTGHSLQEFQVNFKRKAWLPVDFSIPLGGPVPFAVNFDSGFEISTGFSAKSSILSAEGHYHFSGGIVAGFLDGKWEGRVPVNVSATTDIGRSTAGVSIGINSLMLATDIRATVGIGAFGFTSGVFGNLRSSATMLRASDITWPCRQGTIEAFADSGVGYSIPGWAADAVNFFLSFVTKMRIERVGALFQMKPPVNLFHGITQIPSNCASQAAGKSDTAPPPGPSPAAPSGPARTKEATSI